MLREGEHSDVKQFFLLTETGEDFSHNVYSTEKYGA